MDLLDVIPNPLDGEFFDFIPNPLDLADGEMFDFSAIDGETETETYFL